MSANLKGPSGREWTVYAVITLLFLLISAASQALLVPPAWWKLPQNTSQTQEPVAQSPTQPVADPSSPSREATEPKRLDSEKPAANPPANQPSANPPAPPHAKRSDVCGAWLSETSQKQYDFVCHGQGTLQVRQVSGAGLKNTGVGTFTDDGRIEADLMILPKNRTAHLSLKLSPDGQKIVGVWHGDDHDEHGDLTFRRVGKEF
jgi:hypothetical protein